jgi:hypothetical protein
MQNYSFIYAVTLALLVPTAYAMEKENPITPNSFTKEGKEYMEYAVDLWLEAAREGHIDSTAGLAKIFGMMKKLGINYLINDSVVLEKANMGLVEMSIDPVFQTLPVLQMIGDYNYTGAKPLRADVSRVITQAVAMNVLVNACPNFKTPTQNLIGFFASYGQESIPYTIEFLKLNEQLDFADNLPYVAGLTLIMGYLAQTGGGR